MDIFDFILDELPVEVSCLGSRKLDPENEDTAYTTFKYPNGILAHAHASWLNPRKIRQIDTLLNFAGFFRLDSLKFPVQTILFCFPNIFCYLDFI